MYGLQGLGSVSKKVLTPPDCGINILLYGDYSSTEESIIIELKNEFLERTFKAEELCAVALERLGIGTVAYPLYYLYDVSRKIWLCPNEPVTCSKTDGRLLVFRARCMPTPHAIVHNLFSNDPQFARYHFLQSRHDFLNDKITYRKDKNVGREHILGFVVMDLVRYGKEKLLELKQIETLELKHFIPINSKELCKWAWDKHRLRNNIKPYLKSQHEKYIDYSPTKLTLNFILGLHGYIENYGVEIFDVGPGQRVYVDPYHSEMPGIYSLMTQQKETVYFSKIEELVSITPYQRDVKKNSVILNRMSGTPVDHIFARADEAFSFVSLINTYHRLMEDYHHMLCPDSPAVKCTMLSKLNRLGSHGPVSKSWAETRLRERNQMDVAFNYLLKQTSTTLDSLVLVYINDLQNVDFYLIEKINAGYQLNLKDEPVFQSQEELLRYYRNGCQPKVNLNKCVRPTGPLDKRIYLCRKDASMDDTADAMPKQKKAAVSLVSEVTVENSLGRSGHYTEVNQGRWGKDNILVAVKRLRKEEEENDKGALQKLVKAAHKASFWSHPTIVAVHAICLAPNFSILMECGKLGNLEQYLNKLKEENNPTSNYVLVMVAEQLAQALLYLESQHKSSPYAIEKGCCHGNIRTRNIFVFEHEEKLLRIKLGDPGMIYQYNKLDRHHPVNAERLPWVAPELYSNLQHMTLYSDRYAYGITLWEILSRGERPFKYLSTAEEIERYVQEEKTLRKPQNCPEEIYTIMLRCWRRNPEERVSAKEIVRDICSLIQLDYKSEVYDVPQWKEKDSKGSISKKSKKVQNRQINEHDTSLGLDGPFEATSGPAPVVHRQEETFHTQTRAGSFDASSKFGTSQDGEWQPPTRQNLASPSTDSNVSWDSMAPLMGQRSPIGASSMSSLGSGMSRDTLSTVLASQEQLDSFASSPPQVPEQLPGKGVMGRLRLKDDLPKTPDMPEPIQPLNHEHIQIIPNELLGKGHFGEVCKGYFTTNLGNPRPVAIKRLKPKMYEEFATEFEMEFNIMIPLQHPRIIEIIGHCPQKDEDNPMWLVMEYVKNGALKGFLKNNKRSLKVDTMLRFAAEIAEGMIYLNEKNIYHRDLAARNVLVTEDHHMKITDFGLAKAVEKDTSYYRMNTSKDFPVFWYAPEALTYKYNALSDVWSYGITVWEIFSYGEDPKYDLPNNDLRHLYVFLQKKNRLKRPEECPGPVYDEVLQSCWEFDSKNRIPFTEIFNRLNKFVAPPK